MKHVDVPKSSNVWASIFINLLHLTMISTKKHGARSEDRLGPFPLHDVLKSSFMVLTKTIHVCFSTLLVVDW
jgi:hypothetical protein